MCWLPEQVAGGVTWPLTTQGSSQCFMKAKSTTSYKNVFAASYSQFIQEIAFLYNHSPLFPRENVSFHAGFMASTYKPQHSRPSGPGLGCSHPALDQTAPTAPWQNVLHQNPRVLHTLHTLPTHHSSCHTCILQPNHLEPFSAIYINAERWSGISPIWNSGSERLNPFLL